MLLPCLSGVNTEEEKLLDEIVKRVRENIGPVAAFRKVVFVKQIPKTRSGKIPRSALSSLVNGKPYKVNYLHSFTTTVIKVLDILILCCAVCSFHNLL